MKKSTQFSNSSIQSFESKDGYSSDEDLTPAQSCIPPCLRICFNGKNNTKQTNKINPTSPSLNNNSSTQPLETTLVFQETRKNSPDIRPESSSLSVRAFEDPRNSPDIRPESSSVSVHASEDHRNSPDIRPESSSVSVRAFEDPRNSPDIRPESSIDQGHEPPSEVEDLAFSDAQKIRLFNFFANQRNLGDHEINSRSPSPLIEEEDLTDEEKIRAFNFITSSSQNNMDENGLKRYLNLGYFSDDRLPIDFRSKDRDSSGSEASRPMSFFETRQRDSSGSESSRPMSFFETRQRDSNTDNDSGAIIGSNIAISLDQEQFPITPNAQISEIIEEDSLITPATPSSRIIRSTLPSVRLSQVANLPVEDGNFSNDLKIMAFDYINKVAQLGFNNLDNIGKIRRFNAATYVINTNKGMIRTAEAFAGRIPTRSLGESSVLNDKEKIKLFDYFNEILKFKITDTPQARIDKLQRLMKTIYSNRNMIREKLDRRIAKDDGIIPTNRSRQ
jgi:hypothetical protein